MSGPVIVGILVAAGVYLILQRGLVRITLGIILIAHGVNVLILVAGGIGRRGVPIVGENSGEIADPLPAALVLTALVIGLGMTAFLLGLAYRGRRVLGTDDTEEGGPLPEDEDAPTPDDDDPGGDQG